MFKSEQEISVWCPYGRETVKVVKLYILEGTRTCQIEGSLLAVYCREEERCVYRRAEDCPVHGLLPGPEVRW